MAVPKVTNIFLTEGLNVETDLTKDEVLQKIEETQSGFIDIDTHVINTGYIRAVSDREKIKQSNKQ